MGISSTLSRSKDFNKSKFIQNIITTINKIKKSLNPISPKILPIDLAQFGSPSIWGPTYLCENCGIPVFHLISGSDFPIPYERHNLDQAIEHKCI